MNKQKKSLLPVRHKESSPLIRCLQMTIYARFEFIRNLERSAFKKLVKLNEGKVAEDSNSSIRIVFGGDVCLDTEIRMVPFFGVYGLVDEVRKYKILGKIKRKFIKIFCKLFLSKHLVYNLTGVHFFEPLIKIPKTNSATI